MTGKVAKTVKAVKAVKPVAKKPLKDAKTVKDAKPVAKAIAKAVVKKPLKYAKASKATKAVAKKPLKDAKTVKDAKAKKAVVKPVAKKAKKASKPVALRKSKGGGIYDNNVSYNSIVWGKRLQRLKTLLGIKTRVHPEPIEIEIIPPKASLEERIRKFSNSKGKNSQNILYFSKNNKNMLEARLMKHITEHIILKKKSKHFLIMYRYSFIGNESKNETDDGNISFEPLSDDMFENYKDFIRLNAVSKEEKANLQEILRLESNLRTNISELDSESMLNILIQSLLSVGSFHNLVGYIHRECKCENFLYQINSVDTYGYYRYLLDGKSYYLKSCKYNVMISNFEKCKAITDDVEPRLLLEDYKSIVKDFSENKNIQGTSEYNVFMNRLKGEGFNQVFMNRLKGEGFNQRLEQVYSIYTSNKTIDIARDLLNGILLLCLQFFPDIFSNMLPMSGVVLNEPAFELYQEEKREVDFLKGEEFELFI